MNDILTDILDTVRFTSTIYFKHGFCGNWGFELSKGDFAQFHFVTSGNCVLDFENESINLFKGDLVLFPKGNPHKLKAEEGSVCLPGPEILKKITDQEDPFEGNQISSCLVCGHYELDKSVSHFILSELPTLILIRSEDYGRFDLIDNILNSISNELSSQQIGQKTIISRFAEILFVCILRHYYLKQSGSKTNLFNDEVIYGSVDFIHKNLGENLALEELSRQAGISRTAYIERFKSAVGDTPLSYIKEWRLTKAKYLIQYSDLPLREIMLRTGYSSQSSFNRVFKSAFNVSPLKYRQRTN